MNKQIRQFEKFKRPPFEIIKTLKIEVRVDNVVFNDCFEWNINDPSNSPEEYATEIVEELGLSSKFINPTVFAIREQVLEAQKAYQNENRVYYQMHREGKSTTSASVSYNNTTIIRDLPAESREWEPSLKFLTLDEMQRYEKNEERKLRYLQRKK